MATPTNEREIRLWLTDDGWAAIDRHTGVTARAETKEDALAALDDAVADDESGFAVEFADGVEDDAAAAAVDTGLADDPEAGLGELRERHGRYAAVAEPTLEAPLILDVIDRLEDEQVGAQAWNLPAIGTAYNLATDPTLPDLAREPVDTWVDPTVEIRLHQARALLRSAYDRLVEQVGDELAEASASLEESW